MFGRRSAAWIRAVDSTANARNADSRATLGLPRSDRDQERSPKFFRPALSSTFIAMTPCRWNDLVTREGRWGRS